MQSSAAAGRAQVPAVYFSQLRWLSRSCLRPSSDTAARAREYSAAMASSRADKALSAQIRRSAGWVALVQSKLAAWAVGAQARKPARAASGTGTRMGGPAL